MKSAGISDPQWVRTCQIYYQESLPRIPVKALSAEEFDSDYTDCVFPNARAAGLWFGREANRHGTPLQIKTAWEANEDEMRELKEFYED